jgi:outer membrane protein assembly factor BamB
LVERFAAAKLVWRSDVPIPNGMAGDGRNPDRDGPAFISGGYASPIVAGNRVYLQYYVPSGEPSKILVGRVGERFADKFRVEADDVIHCFDGATGKTAWKKVFPKTSLNMQAFTKGGPSLTGCVADGKLYAHFNGGWIHCLDAATGDKLWEFKTDRFEFQEKLRAEARQKQEIALFNRDFKTSPAVVAGVVVFNDHRYHKTCAPGTGDNWVMHYDQPSNLVALDGETGQELWRKPIASNGGQPVPWQGRVIVAGCDGQAHCLDARTGEQLWQVPDADGLTPAVEGGFMVVGGGEIGDGKKDGFHVGYRISETGAEKIWELKSHGRPGLAWPAAADGHLFVESSPRGKLICVALATGQVVGEAPAAKEGHFGYFPRVMGSRIICGGADTDQLHLYTSDPKDFQLLDDAKIPNAWGYEMPMMPALADGRMYFRTHDRLVCMDLRQDAPEGEPFDPARLAGEGGP